MDPNKTTRTQLTISFYKLKRRGRRVGDPAPSPHPHNFKVKTKPCNKCPRVLQSLFQSSIVALGNNNLIYKGKKHLRVSPNSFFNPSTWFPSISFLSLQQLLLWHIKCFSCVLIICTCDMGITRSQEINIVCTEMHNNKRLKSYTNTESKYWLQHSSKIPVEINLYAMRGKVNHESSICTLQKKHGDLKGELWSTFCRSIGGTEARILI